jgi:hypothetical protein
MVPNQVREWPKSAFMNGTLVQLKVAVEVYLERVLYTENQLIARKSMAILSLTGRSDEDVTSCFEVEIASVMLI